MAVAHTSAEELCRLLVEFVVVVEAPFEGSCIMTVSRFCLGVQAAGIER